MNGTRAGAFAVLAVGVLGLTACGSDGPPDHTGMWSASDGSGIKTLGAGGDCSGMYYSDGRPLDIGGGMTCRLSEEAHSDGTYTMLVRQPPNERTYRVSFPDEDTMVLLDSSGSEIVTLTRE